MKLLSIFGLIAGVLVYPIAALARQFAPAGIDVCNISGDRQGALSRTAQVAITLPYLLVTPGTDPEKQATLCGATNDPLGTAYDPAAVNAWFGVKRLTQGSTSQMVASKAIAAGVRIYTDANGKVTDTAVNNSYLVGKALTAAAADGDTIEVDPCFPVKQAV